MSHDHNHSHSHSHGGGDSCCDHAPTQETGAAAANSVSDHDHDHAKRAASKPKTDANDYSRFSDIGQFDEEEAALDKKVDEFHKAPFTLPEAIFAANACKIRGNELFAREIYHESIGAYEEGLKALEAFKELAKTPEAGRECADVRATLIALHGNMSMVHLKDKKFNEAVYAASRVLVMEPLHSKCLFRRASAHHHLNHFEEARLYLGQLLAAEPGNAAAKKELQEVAKSEKEYAARQRQRYGGMFGKQGSNLYEDKEEERRHREKQAREREELLRDQYTQDKIVRRDRGLDEISFEEFRKRQEEEEEEMRKELNEKLPGFGKAAPRPNPTRVPDDDTAEYDDEDAKIIEETKKKGYCYFRNEQAEDVKRLIGDIAPKAINADGAGRSAAAAEGASSAWNHAGTFEEKDTTAAVKDRLRAYLKHVRVELPEVDLTSAAAKEKLTLDEKTCNNSSSAQLTDRLQEMARMLCQVSAAVTGVSKIDGEAQLVHSRGKRKSLFDFGEIVLDFAVQIVSPVDVASLTSTHLEQSGKPEDKIRRLPGTLTFRDFSNDNSVLDHKLSFTKHVPTDLERQVHQAAAALTAAVRSKLREFQMDYESSA